ncbi:hypothetical protein MMC31_002477 [Peltigera leucophlebia]|nr:hypothetical protein [Peltigera leucophlebia]
MPRQGAHTMRVPPGFKKRTLYILVMGLIGAGKSTFISVITGNENIPIGVAEDLDGVTEEVQDYILLHQHDNTLYEIHFIDSPGFDDGTLVDTEVLSRVATYVNTTYKLKKRLAGVLYLHDITKAKVGGVGQRNLRMLEKLIGREEYSNCTLVTTKWGCNTNSQDEENRETTLRAEKKFFGGMLDNAQHASMERFHPRTKSRALEIITPYLKNSFTPQISQQMVDPRGPKLPLGETEAGKVIADNLEKLAQTNLELDKVKYAQEILSQKYDESLFAEFKQKRKVLRRKIRMQRSGRWIMRTTIIGGAITASVLLAGPGLSAFVLVPVFETAVSGQKKKDRKEKEDLKAQFVKASQYTDPDWLWDKSVQELQDVKLYSLKNETAETYLTKVVQRGEFVGIDASEGFEAGLDAAGSAMSENSESSDSDAELSEFDHENE